LKIQLPLETSPEAPKDPQPESPPVGAIVGGVVGGVAVAAGILSALFYGRRRSFMRGTSQLGFLASVYGSTSGVNPLYQSRNTVYENPLYLETNANEGTDSDGIHSLAA